MAEGLTAPDAEHILDNDLADVPEITDTTHRDYFRRQELRSKLIKENRANALKRRSIQNAKWTELYALLKVSTETSAPFLSRELLEMCDMSKPAYGIKDLGQIHTGPSLPVSLV